MRFVILSLLVVLALGAGSFPAAAQAPIGTSVVATDARVILTQEAYRWYENIDNLTPSSSLASLNTATTTPANGASVRLRISLGDASLALPAGSAFSLQFAEATTGPWTTVASSTAWRFLDNPGIADGQLVVTTLLPGSDTGESYAESNPSAASPNTVLPGQEGEWDWSIANEAASTASSWYFRMIYASGTSLDAYPHYPTLTPAPPPSAPTSTAPGTAGAPPGSVVTILHPKPPLTVELPPAVPSPCDSTIVQRVDLNGDCRVDMTDLSILVYYYRGTGPAVARYDFNQDNIIDIMDVSVMMFYWTR